MTTLVIIESPGKIEKLQAILGPQYKVAACYGHVRDLPERDIGVAPPQYIAQYEVKERSAKTISWLKKLCQSSDRILLATDPDREGEAISWHLAEVLRLKNPERISFNKVTESAVTAALVSPRRIDMGRVTAQGARRVIDRLVGYQVSGPLGRTSAGERDGEAMVRSGRDRESCGNPGRPCVELHRTDDPNLSDEAIADIAAYANAHGLPLASEPRRWKAKASAQEGHEATRPTHVEVEEAGDTPEQQALYRLIRIRAIACQLADAEYKVREVALASTDHAGDSPFTFEAVGRALAFKGWRALQAGVAELDEDDEGEGNRAANPVPALPANVPLQAIDGHVRTHQTQPPNRYSKASLVRALEEAGVGRPATYAQIMAGITTRGYVVVEKKRLKPTELGCRVYDALKPHFSFMDIGYTKHMEDRLDQIASGHARYIEVVRDADATLQDELQRLPAAPAVGEGRATASEDATAVQCPNCTKPMVRKQRRSDKKFFWGCTGYPECTKTFDDKVGKPVFRTAK